MNENFFIAGIYYLAVNVITFALFAYDKWCAKHDRWRVKESTLLFWAAIGGGVGAFLAMDIFHHKTLHLKFKLFVPFFLFLHIFFYRNNFDKSGKYRRQNFFKNNFEVIL